MLLLAVFLAAGCKEPDPPIEKLQRTLKSSPEYSIILEDMKTQGDFFRQYFHRYRIIKDNEDRTTGWLRVPKAFYRENRPFLGMVIAGKIEDRETRIVAPPGYQYAGNRRYGSWRETSEGGLYWEFYDRYALFGNVFGAIEDINSDDYKLYKAAVYSKTPFFGSNNQYGTNGSRTRLYKPRFYERKRNVDTLKRASFSDRVKQRFIWTKTNSPPSAENETTNSIAVLDRVFKSLTLTGLFFLIFLAGGTATRLTRREYKLTSEKIRHDNTAVCLAAAGNYIGLAICIGAALSRPDKGIVEESIDLVVYGLLGVVLLNVSWFLCDKLILRYFIRVDKPVRDQGSGAGFIIAGVNIGSGLIIYGAVAGEGGNVWTSAAFWAIAQTVLIISGNIYHLITPYHVHDDIERDDTAAGVVFAGAFIAMGVAAGPVAKRIYSSWIDVPGGFALAAASGLLLLPLVRLITQKLFLPAINLSDEIIAHESPTLSAAYIEASIFITASLIVYWCV